MRWHLLLLLPVIGLLLGADDVPKGLEKVQGSWSLAALTVEGKDIPDAKASLMLKGDKYTFTAGEKVNKGVYKVDVSKKPMALDIVCMEGPDKGKTLPAIFEVEGDSLKICLTIKGKDRPVAFVSKPDSGTVLESWKKAK